MSIFSKLFSFASSDPLKIYGAELAKINTLKDSVEKLSSEQIKARIDELKNELALLKDKAKIFARLKEIRPEVFALVREAAKRSIGQFHYDVQIIGGLALSESRIAEMKTGEGKTLTATAPLSLFALAGRGAHLVTVNDYLARWQASIMGPIFYELGLSVASIQHEASFLYDPNYQPEAEEIAEIESRTEGLVLDVKHMRPVSRREAYAADITYGTNNEFGFDYLRDNMVQTEKQLVQRELFFAIVDEVDSILIDEARTPLIISQPDTDPTDKYVQFAKLIGSLEQDKDYEVIEKNNQKAAPLTEDGITKIEKLLNVENIYDTSQGITTLHQIEQALKAKTLFKRDRDYVVRDGEIIIVDEFTGRLMFGRRYSEGLHQAIEAKEGVKIQQESKTLATITFQNLFRLYDKLSGMTGTAKTEEEEFFKIYKLEVAQIPTNKENIRKDESDLVYKNESGKFAAIAKDVKERHKRGQPVLIGTVSIAKNEMLADHLKKEGLKFELLNAKNHEREANIIAQAGRLGAITLATNIAGRGVDILLGGNPVNKEEAEAVKNAGGLAVIGTERHESRRIDNQLRGRSGRQGDPGTTQFYVSMEDDLMRIFGGERMQRIMETLRIPADQPIEAKLVSRSIESSQKKIEGFNFDARKNVLEYDDVLNHQRSIVYGLRKKYLLGEKSDNQKLKHEILDLIYDQISRVITSIFSVQSGDEAKQEVIMQMAKMLPVTDEVKNKIDEALQNAANQEFALIDLFKQEAEKIYSSKEEIFGAEVYNSVVRQVALRSIDMFWMEHLDTMDHLRDSVRLRGIGQRDPLVEYKREGFALFQRLQDDINNQIAFSVLRLELEASDQVQQVQQPVINLNNVVTSAGGEKQHANLSGSQVDKSVGRNDPCPCGSGKKYKKCGLVNAPEHKV